MTKHTIYGDFETYYDSDYSLSKMTTAEYVNDSRFEAIMFCFAIDDGPVQYIDGADWAKMMLAIKALPWGDSTFVAHNAMFDASILEWKFGVRPARYFCTMMGARPHIVPFTGSMSLAKVSEHFELPPKGGEVVNMKGIYRRMMNAQQLLAYRAYCEHDVDLCRIVHQRIAPSLPPISHDMIHVTVRKFVKPQLNLDKTVLVKRLDEIRQEKEDTLAMCGVMDAAELRSNPKFAQALMALGVDPPTKISPTTGEETYAFAKSDEGFAALLEHEDSQVQVLAAARLRHKSTMEESRIDRLLQQPVYLPIPLMYYAAHTGRLGGWDKMNFQNLPSRGGSKALRASLVAPPGYEIIASDLSQIEARILATLAGSELVEYFRQGMDVYKVMAAQIFKRHISQVTDKLRFFAKVCVLGLGYGMGVDKFQDTLRIMGHPVTRDEARAMVYAYRDINKEVVRFWEVAQRMLIAMISGEQMEFSIFYGKIILVTGKDFILLPNGMSIHYPNIRLEPGSTDIIYDGWEGKRRVTKRIYGGKLTENIVQALAQIIINEMELVLASREIYAALQVHDELVFVVRRENADKIARAVEFVMSRPPNWLPSLPVACEVKRGTSYAEAK